MASVLKQLEYTITVSDDVLVKQLAVVVSVPFAPGGFFDELGFDNMARDFLGVLATIPGVTNKYISKVTRYNDDNVSIVRPLP